ncbi:NDP-sugar synthase [bacterium]|nr:NDP-sugar synthase [bacterium]
MKGMILTAGLGTRFKPLSDYTPKPLIEIIDRPIIDYSIKKLVDYGVNDIILNLHHKKEQILDYFKDNPKYRDIKIKFSYEDELMGTSGGVKKAEYFFGGKSFIVINSDMLFDLDIHKLMNFHEINNADITLCLGIDDRDGRYGTLGVDENFRVMRYLKTSITCSERYKCLFKGIHIISPHILKEIPENTFQDFSKHTYPYLLKRGYKIYGYISDENWYPLGNMDEYRKVCHDFLSNDGPFKLKYPEVCQGIFISPDAEIDKSVDIIKPVIISANTAISPNCKLGPNMIIGADCRIESDVEINNSIIFSKVHIPKGAQISNKICTPLKKVAF